MQNICYNLIYTNANNSACSKCTAKLEDVILELYYLINNTNYNLCSFKIVSYYMYTVFSELHVCFNNGLVLYSDVDKIRISTLFPQFIAMDNIYIRKNKFQQNQPFPQTTNENTRSAAKTSLNPKKTRRHPGILKNKQIADQVKNNEPVKKVDIYFDEEFELKKEKERLDRVNQNRCNEQIKIFESDKKSYTQVKKDISLGILKKSEINPFFSVKFDVFKLLESRKEINFENNNNINSEYEIFNQLYNLADSSDDEIISKNEINGLFLEPNEDKVYVPHNFYYYTESQKEEYAKKYKMTLDQFLTNYVSKEYGLENKPVDSLPTKQSKPAELTTFNETESSDFEPDDFEVNVTNDSKVKSNESYEDFSKSASSSISEDYAYKYSVSGADTDSDPDTDFSSHYSNKEINDGFLITNIN